MSQAGESVDSGAERLREWHDARARALHAYETWCAATRSDRRQLYMVLLDALRREEHAGWQVEGAPSGQSAADRHGITRAGR